MTPAERLLHQACRDGPASVSGRRVLDILEAADVAAKAASTMDDMPGEVFLHGLGAWPEFQALIEATDRMWLT